MQFRVGGDIRNEYAEYEMCNAPSRVWMDLAMRQKFFTGHMHRSNVTYRDYLEKLRLFPFPE